MTNDQLLSSIDQRLEHGQDARLWALTYSTYTTSQLQATISGAVQAGCVYSVLTGDDEAVVFIQGSPAELDQCARIVSRLLVDGD